MSEEPTHTSLKIVTGGWELEVSVNMETVPLKVYQETKKDRETECWVASKAGKMLEDYMYDKSTCQVQIDGQQCASIWARDQPYTTGETRVGYSSVREWVFAQPRLDEDDGPSGGHGQGSNPPDLGAITFQYRRAREAGRVPPNTYYAVQDSGSISEKTKKGILGAVTSFREKQAAPVGSGLLTQSKRKPEDEKLPFWSFRFNYAPEAVLQAQGRIPIKHNIEQGEAGRSARAPIDLDDDGQLVRPAKDKKPRADDGAGVDDPDAREAALLAELEILRNRKRKKSSGSIELSDDESKAAVMRRISKKLANRKAMDDGKVDLTLDSD